MSSFSRIIIAGVLVICLAGPLGIPKAVAQNAPPTPSQATQAQVRTLANGLRVVVVEDPSAPVVQTGMWYRFGSLYETPGKTGLAHALEHMNFRGTQALSSAGLTDLVARLGIQDNADTSNDYTHFYFVLPADQLDLALHIEADRMHDLLLSQADWNLEKGAVLTEIDTDFSNPTSKLYYNVRRAAFPAFELRADRLGANAPTSSARPRPTCATIIKNGVRAEQRVADRNRRRRPCGRRLRDGAKVLPVRSPARCCPRIDPAPRRRRRATSTSPSPPTTRTASSCSRIRCPAISIPPRLHRTFLPSVINNQRSPFFKALVESNITLGYNAFTDTQLRGGLFYVQLVVAPDSTPQKRPSPHFTHDPGESARSSATASSSGLVDAAEEERRRPS